MNHQKGPSITVAGAGFAAITGIRELRKHIPDAAITLVAPRPEFVYLPSLIWVPYGLRSGEDIRFDIRPLLEDLDVEYRQAAATGISSDGRTLETDGGSLQNDALLIATGGRYIRKLPGIENVITICEGIESAERMGSVLRSPDGGTIALGFGGNPKEPSAMRGTAATTPRRRSSVGPRCERASGSSSSPFKSKPTSCSTRRSSTRYRSSRPSPSTTCSRSRPRAPPTPRRSVS